MDDDDETRMLNGGELLKRLLLMYGGGGGGYTQDGTVLRANGKGATVRLTDDASGVHKSVFEDLASLPRVPVRILYDILTSSNPHVLVSADPLPYEAITQIKKAMTTKAFASKPTWVLDNPQGARHGRPYRMGNGVEFFKDALRKYGNYRHVTGEAVLRTKGYADIPIGPDGGLEEFDLNDVHPRVLRVLYNMLVHAPKVRKTMSARRTAQARRAKRAEAEHDETMRSLEQVRRARRALEWLPLNYKLV